MVLSLSDNILRHTDILIPNQAEMALLCNCSASIDITELSRQADTMLQKGVGAVLFRLPLMLLVFVFQDKVLFRR